MKKRLFIVIAVMIASGICLKTEMGVAQHKKEDNRPGISFGIMAGAEKTATSCGQVTMKIFRRLTIWGWKEISVSSFG